MTAISTGRNVDQQPQQNDANKLAQAAPTPGTTSDLRLPERDVAVALSQLHALKEALSTLRSRAPDPEAVMSNAALLYEIATNEKEFPEASVLAKELVEQLNKTKDATQLAWTRIETTRSSMNSQAPAAEQIQQAIENGMLTGAHLTPDSLPKGLFQASVSLEKLSQQLGIPPQDYQRYLEIMESGTASPADVQKFFDSLRNGANLPTPNAIINSFPNS